MDKIIQNIEYIPKKTKQFYIDHGMYLNGIYFQEISEKNMIIYTNNYPKGFCVFDFRKNNKIKQYSELMALNNKYNSKKKLLMPREKSKILKKPTLIPWMKKQFSKTSEK